MVELPYAIASATAAQDPSLQQDWMASATTPSRFFLVASVPQRGVLGLRHALGRPERGLRRRRVGVLFEARDLAVADSEDMDPRAVVGLAGGLHAPSGVAGDGHLVAFGNEGLRFEVDDILRLFEFVEKLRYLILPVIAAGERNVVRFRADPLDLVVGEREHALDILILVTLVGLHHDLLGLLGLLGVHH